MKVDNKEVLTHFDLNKYEKVGLIEDPNGFYKTFAKEDKKREFKTVDYVEATKNTFFSLCSGNKVFWSSGIKTLTPKALLFLARINATSQVKTKDFASKYLKDSYEEISERIINLLVGKMSKEKAEKTLAEIEKSWDEIMKAEKKLEIIFSLYDEILLPSVENWDKVIPVPLFDTYIVKNCFDYIRFLTSYKTHNKKEDREKALEELSKIRNKASSYLDKNSLHKFMDQNIFRADFNVLIPFTHIPGAVWEVNGLRIDRDGGIFVPPSSDFNIGDTVAVLRHPSSTGVELLKVVGYTEDDTIRISEIYFRKFLADADGDFVLISEALTWLITGKRNK